MKTTLKLGILALLVVAALAFTGFAFASSNGLGVRDLLSGTYEFPQDSQDCGDCDGIMQEYIQAAWAEVFGMEVSELQEMLASGLTYYQIALNQGIVETQEEFRSLLSSVLETAFDNAASDGVITPEQAQQMLQHMNRTSGAGMRGHMNTFGGMKMRGESAPFGPLSFQAGLLEEFLGLTREQVQARIRNGETLEEILAEQGKTAEEWSAYTLQAHQERLNLAVENGELTRAQADALLLQLQERFENGWTEPLGPVGPIGVPGEGGPSFGMPGMYGPGEPSGGDCIPDEGGQSWGTPGTYGPGGHHGPNMTPPENGNENGNGNNK